MVIFNFQRAQRVKKMLIKIDNLIEIEVIKLVLIA